MYRCGSGELLNSGKETVKVSKEKVWDAHAAMIKGKRWYHSAIKGQVKGSKQEVPLEEYQEAEIDTVN